MTGLDVEFTADADLDSETIRLRARTEDGVLVSFFLSVDEVMQLRSKLFAANVDLLSYKLLESDHV